jgi:hypothetical protein
MFSGVTGLRRYVCVFQDEREGEKAKLEDLHLNAEWAEGE